MAKLFAAWHATEGIGLIGLSGAITAPYQVMITL